MIPHLVVSEADEAEFAGFLQEQIREYNSRQSLPHREARRPGGLRPLNVTIKDETDQVMGGLSGRAYWDWLEIDHLFVPGELRGQGIGSSLLQVAERAAVRRGANHCFLSTFEFRARAFYEKHGYSIAGKLEGYPPGSTYFWMRKELGRS
jgi:GNAT superfamily N-acetyltransferase